MSGSSASDGHPSLAGRVMFTSSGEGQPDGAVVKENDPGDGTRLRALVSKAFTPRRIEALAPGIEETATRLLDGLLRRRSSGGENDRGR